LSWKQCTGADFLVRGLEFRMKEPRAELKSAFLFQITGSKNTEMPHKADIPEKLY